MSNDDDNLNGLPVIPEPRDPASHDEPRTVDETEPAELVPVDQPATDPPILWADRWTLRGRRPIIASWLRSWTDFCATVRHFVVFCLHVCGFHAVRLPLYGLMLLRRSPAGTRRLLGALGRWLIDAEGHHLRVLTASGDNAADYLKLTKQRDHRVKTRGIVTLAAVALLAVLVVAGLALLPRWVFTVCVLCLAGAVGWAGVPADQPVIGRAVLAARIQRLTSDVVTKALVVLGVSGITSAMSKDPNAIRFTAPIVRDGPGWRAEIDLPPGVVVTEVMDKRDKLASALARPLGCVWPEGNATIHPGHLTLWVGDQDMNTAPQPPWPLAKSGLADVFRPMPIGTDQRGRIVTLTLMFVSMLIGSVPRMGKSVLLRVLLLIAALDPRVQILVFDLKGTGDHAALGHVADRYRSGDDESDMLYILAALRELRHDMRRRAKTIRSLPSDLCPDSKVTPTLADNRSLGLWPVVVGIDECHKLFEHPKYGAEFAELVEDLVRRGPAVGIIVILATQRPDAKSIPTSITSNVVIRFCLKVIGHEANDIILGTGAHRAGIRATTFTVRDKGIGYLAGEEPEPKIVHGANIEGPAADEIARRARSIRQTAGQITGYAAGTDSETGHAEQQRASTLLADILAVVPADHEKEWSETVVDRLVRLRPDVYGPLGKLETGTAKATQLAVMLKPYGVKTDQVWGTDPVTGKGANRRGIVRAEVATAYADLRRQQADHA